MDVLNLRKEQRHICENYAIPGRLVLNRQQDIQAEAIDVSRVGLGIMANQEVLPGTDMWLILSDRTIRMEVRFCQPITGSSAKFRLGLESKVPWEDLTDLVGR